MFSCKRLVLWALCVSISLLVLVGCSSTNTNSGTEIQKDSAQVHLDFENLTQQQHRNLQKLCKVWGYVKYYHPEVVSGKIDVDEQLLNVLPNVLATEQESAVNKVISDWVGALGQVEQESVQGHKQCIAECMLSPTTQWIHDAGYLGEDLKAQLEPLENLYLLNRNKAYVSFDGVFANFKNEEAYPKMQFDNKEMRLLSLFRYWNAVEYYYPYKNIIGEDWDEVLLEFIPKFLEGEDKVSYVLDIAEISTKIHDPHARVYDKDDTFIRQFGEYILPVKFTSVDGEVVITKVMNLAPEKCTLKQGDIVRKFDGKNIEDVINEKLKYVSVSFPEKFTYPLQNYLFRTDKQEVEITVERDGKQITEKVVTLDKKYLPYGEKPSHELLEGKVGLINPAFISKDQIHSIMEEFWDTEGIIIDLRQYPSDFIVYSLAEYLIEEPTEFVMFTAADQIVPGSFVAQPIVSSGGATGEKGVYPGKVAILMNEESVSQSEFTVMSLRNTPKAKVIGSSSRGTDGNVVEIPLPGDITTIITGLGVFTPNGGQTQRIGLAPDILVTPTIEGISEGRDELIDAAIEYINKK